MQLIEFFDRGAEMAPERLAFVDPDGGGALTYAAAQVLTHRIAVALHRDGIAPGTPVGVLSPNTPLVFPCVLGVARAGCAWVALNDRTPPQELAGLLNLVGAEALLYSVKSAAAVRRLRQAVPGLKLLVPIDDDADPLSAWLAPPDARAPAQPLDPEGIAGLFGTGGTTGRPKAVALPHRAFETMVHAFNSHLPETDPVNLVAAPLTHAAGAALVPVLGLAGTNVVHSSVDPARILSSIEENRVTRLFLPPTAVYALLDHPDVRTRDLSSLRYFLYGAAPISVRRLTEALEVFGPVMAQFYGQTELPMMCSFLSPEEHAAALAEPGLRHRLASCGRPSLVANVAIRAEDGSACPVGEPGEIVVRSELRMAGYHGDPEQTAAAHRPGGAIATGDIGYRDADGYLYIVDRKKDLIISGGFNVFPGEIEQVLAADPAVRDCAVIGVPDEKWGERVTAVVELRPGAQADADALIALCRERLGPVKAPKQVLFRPLPRSAIGKVLKRALREEFWTEQPRRV
ncbi:AMP-binding protein [Catenulispora rubra]|uniref:AMP-binding protein n=1 Tax=Catenulispora rubra TaxID=280293 RepID=UPI00189207AF|nr:AMP-binding protein [Catenulispora rubra]